jgi:hypothetical protein
MSTMPCIAMKRYGSSICRAAGQSVTGAVPLDPRAGTPYLAQPVEEERHVEVEVEVLRLDVPLEAVAPRTVQHGDRQVRPIVVLPEESRLEGPDFHGSWRCTEPSQLKNPRAIVCGWLTYQLLVACRRGELL